MPHAVKFINFELADEFSDCFFMTIWRSFLLSNIERLKLTLTLTFTNKTASTTYFRTRFLENKFTPSKFMSYMFAGLLVKGNQDQVLKLTLAQYELNMTQGNWFMFIRLLVYVLAFIIIEFSSNILFFIFHIEFF